MTYLDAAGAVRDWVNAQAALVGVGNPLQLGASLKQREGAASACYGLIVELPAYLWGGAEQPSHGQRISMQIYGPTKEAAALAAVAYGNALMPLLQGVRSVTPQGVLIVGVDNVDGPTWIPDGDEPRYVVDCDFLFG
jgi:hypothetical protein